MTRSLAPRAHTKPPRKRIAPDPTAVLHWRCRRCNRLVWAHGIVSECFSCIDQAVKAFGLGPVEGEVSGC